MQIFFVLKTYVIFYIDPIYIVNKQLSRRTTKAKQREESRKGHKTSEKAKKGTKKNKK